MSDKDHHRKRKAEREALREELLEAQFELRTLQHGSVLLLISGNDFAGKAEIIHSFYEWLDNRYLNTRAFALPKGVERRMPRLWRLPPRGPTTATGAPCRQRASWVSTSAPGTTSH